MLCTRYSQPNPHRMGLRRESDTDLRAGAGPTCSFGPELDVVVAGGGVWDRIPTLRRLHVAVPVGRTNGQCVRTGDRKSTRLNSSHVATSYAGFCLNNKTNRCVPTVPPDSDRP